jgi:hypothetical protein
VSADAPLDEWHAARVIEHLWSRVAVGIESVTPVVGPTIADLEPWRAECGWRGGWTIRDRGGRIVCWVPTEDLANLVVGLPALAGRLEDLRIAFARDYLPHPFEQLPGDDTSEPDSEEPDDQ